MTKPSSEAIMEGVEEDEDWQLKLDQDLKITNTNERIGLKPPSDMLGTFPVRLTVKYDGVQQSLTLDEFGGKNNFTMSDPKAGQRVTFDLVNQTKEKLGVVLALNGNSLLYDQYAGDPRTNAKFVLEPGIVYEIKGVYQSDLKSFQPIIGLSDNETKDKSQLMNADATGLIHLHVFRNRTQLVVDSGDKLVDEDDDGRKKGKKTDVDPSPLDDVDSKTKSKERRPQPLELSSFSYDSGFQMSMASKALEGKKARGSFQPTQTTTKANSWQELKKQACDGLYKSMVTSKGLAVPKGEKELQNVEIKEIGEVEHTDTLVIRYLNLAKMSAN